MASDSTEYLRQAGEVIARAARDIASTFSRRIPAATKVVQAGDNRFLVITDGQAAPNAAPFEYAERHPLFGDEDLWYKQPKRPYMVEAAEATADQAMNKYATYLDKLARRHGYR